MTDEPRWLNSLGDEVDLDDIDREYALNILSMVIARRAVRGCTADDMRNDPLIQKLRDVVLNGRDKTPQDIVRGRVYNMRNARRGCPWRAPV